MTGTGTRDDPYLGWQAAIAPDTTVTLAAGKVYGLAADLRLPAGAELACEDRSAVILYVAEGVAITNLPNAGGIALRHCTIDANGERLGKKPRNAVEFAAGTGQDDVFEDLLVRGATKAGIKIQGTVGTATRARVTHCRFEDLRWHGAEFSTGVSQSSIVDCDFVHTNQGGKGASIYFSGEDSAGNQMLDNRVEASGDNGIRIKGSGHLVRGNEVHLGRTDGIRDEGVGDTISGNTVRAPDECCIKVGHGAHDSVIDGNTCEDAGTDNDGNPIESRHGIATYTDRTSETRVDHVTITHNVVVRAGADCIHLESATGANATTNAVIEDNTCVQPGGFGIRATRGSTYHVANNKVEGSRLPAYGLEGRELHRAP